MATPKGQRPLPRPAQAGRFVVLGTALLALLACTLVLVVQPRPAGRSTPPFLADALGPAQQGGELPSRRTGARSATAVRGGGYTVSAAGATVSLASAGAANAGWTPHQNGAIRPTATGEE